MIWNIKEQLISSGREAIRQQQQKNVLKVGEMIGNKAATTRNPVAKFMKTEFSLRNIIERVALLIRYGILYVA